MRSMFAVLSAPSSAAAPVNGASAGSGVPSGWRPAFRFFARVTIVKASPRPIPAASASQEAALP